MSRRGGVRTEPCSNEDARKRLKDARSFLEVAEMTAEEGGDGTYAGVAASLAVLAGIAASDAACCRALGRRARGEDHREATALLAQVEPPRGEEASKALSRLLGVKGPAQYGFDDVSGVGLRAALRQAAAVVEFAGDVLAR